MAGCHPDVHRDAAAVRSWDGHGARVLRTRATRRIARDRTLEHFTIRSGVMVVEAVLSATASLSCTSSFAFISREGFNRPLRGLLGYTNQPPRACARGYFQTPAVRASKKPPQAARDRSHGRRPRRRRGKPVERGIPNTQSPRSGRLKTPPRNPAKNQSLDAIAPETALCGF